MPAVHRAATRRLAALLACLLLVGGSAACSGDDGDDRGTDADTETTVSEAAPTDDPAETETETETETESEEDGAITALTGTEICDRLPATVVGSVLDLDVASAEADDDGTPQCSYGYDVGGGTSNVTVASMRGDEDLGGREGAEAFAHVVELNETAAAGTEYEVVGIAAGERAVVFEGSALLFGAVLVEGHIFTVIVPRGDAPSLQVQALVARVATQLP